jgi:DNA-binding response OmpR family regulator
MMLTADASKAQAHHAQLLGAGDFLTKPLDIVSFLAAVARQLELPEGGTAPLSNSPPHPPESA